MKAAFLTPLRLEDVDGIKGVLLEPLKFYSVRHRGVFVVLPGFQTDFASIPRGLWNIFPKRGKHDPAAVLHDAAYQGAVHTKDGRRVHLMKKYADALFLEALEARGVNWLSRKLMYRAVVLFGDTAYRSESVGHGP